MKDNLIKWLKDGNKRIAYKVDNNYITYEELLNKSLYYADLLKREGTSPIIIYGHKQIDMIISICSCIIAGRTYVPIDTFTPISRINKIIEITKASLIIKCEDIDKIESIYLEDLSKYKNNKINNILDNNIIYIIFTSGTTGTPKGVPISSKNLLNFIKWISNIYPLNEYRNINVLNTASFSFDLSVADIYYSISNNHTLVSSTNKDIFNIESICNTIKDNNINFIIATPTYIKLCLLNPNFNNINYPKLDSIYFCGETLDKKTTTKLMNRFPNIKLINAYGPTEATSAISSILITKDILNNNDVLPIGDMSNSACTIELIGDEIVLKGNSVFSGYLNVNSNNCYIENNINCYKTGDLGYIKDNLLYYNGRIDNQIKFKGYRIELDDIENEINKINIVKNSAVIAKKENNIVKSIIAYVVMDNNYDIDYIKNILKEKLPNYMIPKKIIKINKLPINKNGKIDRKKLMEL